MNISATRGGYALSAPYSESLVKACRASCLSWNPRDKTWRGSAEQVIEAAAASGYRVDISPAPPRWTKRLVAPSGLREYQDEAVSFLLTQGEGGCILGDEMGLGKTVSAIVAARILREKTLVVCPNIMGMLPAQWAAEASKWWSSAGHGRLKGKSPGHLDARAGIIICHYEILDAWRDALLEWAPRVVILDECQWLSNAKSGRTKAAAEICADAEYRWGLTGTPMANRPKDLWAPADVISPGALGHFLDFARRYCGAFQKTVKTAGGPRVVWDFKGASNLGELHRRITDSGFLLRRTKSQVALELPAMTRQVLWVDVAKKGPMAVSAKEIRAVLDRATDQKLPGTLELVAGHLDAGKRVLVGCYRRHVAEWFADSLRALGHATGLIHGQVPSKERDAALTALGAAQGGFAMCVTIDATSTGLNALTSCDTGVVAELLYEPQKLLQFEARLHRSGQRSAVLWQYPCARGTADELVAEMIITKLENISAAVGDSGDLQVDLRGAEDLEANFLKAMGES